MPERKQSQIFYRAVPLCAGASVCLFNTNVHADGENGSGQTEINYNLIGGNLISEMECARFDSIERAANGP